MTSLADIDIFSGIEKIDRLYVTDGRMKGK